MSESNLHLPPPGLLLVLSAPSGAGKTTLARRLLDGHSEAVVSISFTTRRPRGTEEHGVDYFFVDDAKFDRMVAQGAFAEWAAVHGARYGSPRAQIDDQVAARRIVIFDIDVQGGEQVQAVYPEAVTVLIVPPSMKVLEQRLRDRSTDDDEAIARRLGVARQEMTRAAKSYRYLVVNDDLEQAYRELEAIVLAERLRLARVDLPFWLDRVGC